MQTFKKLLFLLTPYERKRAGLLLIMILIMASLDMVGVASILPFIAVLTNPSLIETNAILNTMFQTSNFFGVENNKQFLFALGVLVFIFLIVSLAFKALTNYVQVRFIRMREYSISKRLVEGYLQQPYSWFLDRHSADLGKTILSEAQQVIAIGLRPLGDLIAQSVLVIAILILLVLIDLKLTLIVCLSLGATYGIIFYSIRSYAARLGKVRLKNNQLRFMAVSEAFGATKEVKVGGLEKKFIDNFSSSAFIYARIDSQVQVISELPRYILEAIAFGGVLLIILYMMAQSGSFNNALPIISLYAFAGYRLMPALQMIYVSFTQLTFVGPTLNKIYDDLKSLKPLNKNYDQVSLPLNNKLILKNINYNYPNSSRIALKNINLNIHAKTTVGLVGATGSGKTTVVDIMLGLLEAQKGTLEVDGKIITKENLRHWQRSIGYVPQQIYLSDDTVAANIAFGVEPNDIKEKDIEKAAKIANLHDFVINQLPEQYKTTIGERGVRLSGGQRQRIGIARALYHNPQVLILDEATSALDNETESIVMEAVNNINRDITIILITHRLSTVKNCDNIFLLENGEMTAQGSFNDLANTNKTFSTMARNY
jgi:ABC-type multidrug transport system fused ATPase/permease subunit